MCRVPWVARVLGSIFHWRKRRQTVTEEQRKGLPEESKAPRLRVLVVEDDEGVATTLKDTIEAAIANTECVVQPNFEAACNMLNTEIFDAVVLDQFEGEKSQTNKKAEQVWKTIWDIQFMPVVVYSGFELELDDNFPRDHPVLTYIPKGSEHDAVAKHIALITLICRSFKLCEMRYATLSGARSSRWHRRFRSPAKNFRWHIRPTCESGAETNRSNDGLEHGPNRFETCRLGTVPLSSTRRAVAHGGHFA